MDRAECARADANLHQDSTEINYSSVLSNHGQSRHRVIGIEL